MKIKPRSKWLYLTAGLAALLLAPVGNALGQPEQCIKENEKCNYEVLCAFKIELAEKMLLFKTFVENSPKTKAAKKSTLNGIKHSGKLYDEALAEAKKEDPKATAGDLASLAYNKFAAKAQAKLDSEASKYANCGSITPKAGLRGTWTGMRTSKTDCTVYGNPPKGSSEIGVSLDSYKKQSTGCLEVWDSDRGHEAVHEEACRKRLAMKERPPLSLQDYIDEDTEAYRYNVQHAMNDLSQMQIRCTHDPKTNEFRKRADELLKKAAQYQAQQAGKP